MGLGLESAYGAEGAAERLRQILMDRFARQQALHAQSIQDQQIANQTRGMDLNEADRRDRLAETTRQHTIADEDRNLNIGMKLSDQIQPGFLPETNQAVGFLRKVGAGTDLPATLPMGKDFTGPMENDETPQQAQTGRMKGFLKAASTKQVDTEADNKRQQTVADAALAAAQGKETPDEASARRQREHAANRTFDATHPVANPGDKLVKVEHKGPDGRTVIEWLPQSELKGKQFQKGVSSATDSRLASAEAVKQTGDDIIARLSDPAVKAQLGPTMGRYSKLQDFLGNPPPEFAELAGQIESYSLANMGVHGMRSAQGAQKIAQLLNQPHTPESIIAAIKGLNAFSEHFMQNEGRGSAAPKTDGKPKFEILSVK
jgi:hypothetical protein